MEELKHEDLDQLDTKHLISFLSEENGITEKNSDTIIFLFQFIHYLEKRFENVVSKMLEAGMKPEFLRPDIFRVIYSRLSFSDKIHIFKEIVKPNSAIHKKYKKFIDFATQINVRVRNNLFHLNLNEINFEGKDVSDIQTQRLMMAELLQIKDNS